MDLAGREKKKKGGGGKGKTYRLPALLSIMFFKALYLTALMADGIAFGSII